MLHVQVMSDSGNMKFLHKLYVLPVSKLTSVYNWKIMGLLQQSKLETEFDCVASAQLYVLYPAKSSIVSTQHHVVT